jgi:hypothetical protein
MAMHIEHGPGSRENRWRIAVWGTAACLLLLPLGAMQFDTGVDWTGSDFAVMGAMLAAACGIWELGMWLSRNRAYRAAFAVAALGAFLMTWINLAVGIIGNENDRLNLLFFAVLAVGIVGALVARFRPLGLAAAMVAMAGAQSLVGVLTLVVHGKTAALSGFFTAVWLFSAWLFARAARENA